MHGADGKDYPNFIKYTEVVPRSRLAYDHGATDDTPSMFRVTATFREVEGHTHLDFQMRFPSPEAARQAREFVKQARGESTWDRLAEYLDDERGQQRFYINRSFDVAIERMYDLWTRPEHLAAWLAPGGASMEFLRADIRPGGSSFYRISGAHGEMYGHVEYREMDRPNRLVYIQQFCDENECIARHPLSATWPETMLTIIRFAAEGPNRTRVTVQWEPWEPTAAELETFVNARSGMAMGWTGSLDQLEAKFCAG
jgi:uncharacterized protein YndB with AHSA1/START domain